MKAAWGSIAISLLLLLPMLSAHPVSVNATPSSSPCPSSSVSCIYISPLGTCCSGNTPIAPGSPATLNVMLNLVNGQAFNGFDVRLNYTNPDLYRGSGTLRTESIDYSNSMLQGHNPQPPDAKCIDGIGLLANGAGCAPDDYPAPGQIHFAQGISGLPQITGPVSGLLFSITFNVTGRGTSLVYFDRANLVNLNPQPPGSGNFSPIYVPLVRYAAVFGNQGMTALFNYSPADAAYSVSIIRGQTTIFDASGSLQALNSSITPSRFSWSFGDSMPAQNTTSSTIQHTFSAPGNYSVTLSVTDSMGGTGSITRVVSVVSILGRLLLTVVDQSGTLLRNEVNVALYNSSGSARPFVILGVDNGAEVTFKNLVPGTYYASFSGPRVVASSRFVNVTAGVTSQATVYLPLITNPVDYSWLFFVVPMVGTLTVVGGVALVKRRNGEKGRRSTKSGGGLKRRP